MRPFTARDGAVFHGDVYRSPDECQRLLDGYLRDVEADDWWSPFARRRADELFAAMLAAYQEDAA